MRSPSLPRWLPLHRSTLVPLRLVLVLPFVLQIAVAVGLAGYLSFRNAQQSIHRVTLELQSEVSQRVIQYLQAHLSIADRLNRLNAAASADGQLIPTDAMDREQHWSHQLQHFPEVSHLLFSDRQGRVSVVSQRAWQPQNRQNPSLNYPAPDPTTADFWSRVALQNSSPGPSSVIFSPEEANAALVVHHRVYDRHNALLGVFATVLDLAPLHQFMADLSVGHTGRVFIVDHHGLLVSASTWAASAQTHAQPGDRIAAATSSDDLTRLASQALLQTFGSFQTIQTRHSLTIPLRGDRGFVHVVPYQAMGVHWWIVVAQPESDFMNQVWGSTYTTFLLYLAALGLATVVGLLTAHWIARPIQHLSRASRKMMLGEWEYPLKQTSCIAEMDVLLHSYNQMAQQIEQAFDEMKTELQESEEKFTKTFRLSPDLMLIISLYEERVLEANTSFLEFSGLSREQVIGRPLSRLNLWANAQERHRFRTRLEHNRSVRNLEVLFRGQNGSIYTMLLSAETLVLEGQSCLIAIAKDITERKHLEVALLDSEARYRAIVETQTELIVQSTPDAIVTFVNEAVCQASGFCRSDIIGYHWKQFIHPDDVEWVLDKMQSLTPSQPTFFTEHRIIVANGAIRWFQWMNQGIFDDQDCLVEIQSVGRQMSDSSWPPFSLSLNHPSASS